MSSGASPMHDTPRRPWWRDLSPGSASLRIGRRSRARRRRRPALDWLEDRQLLAGNVSIGAVAAQISATVNVDVAFTRVSDWGSGFTANLVIKNNGSSPINGWT